jgi:hypothetical protein
MAAIQMRLLHPERPPILPSVRLLASLTEPAESVGPVLAVLHTILADASGCIDACRTQLVLPILRKQYPLLHKVAFQAGDSFASCAEAFRNAYGTDLPAQKLHFWNRNTAEHKLLQYFTIHHKRPQMWDKKEDAVSSSDLSKYIQEHDASHLHLYVGWHDQGVIVRVSLFCHF